MRPVVIHLSTGGNPKTPQEAGIPEGVIDYVWISLIGSDIAARRSVVVCNRTSGSSGTHEDPNLFPKDGLKVCHTCNCPSSVCLGHLGRIAFYEPMVHPLLTRQFIQVLKSICHTCSRALLTRSYHELRGISKTKLTRLDVVSKASDGALCSEGCPKNPVFSFTQMDRTIVKTNCIKIEKDGVFFIEGLSHSGFVRRSIEGISDEDARLLGWERGHPRDMIIENYCVIPPNSRIGGLKPRDGMIITNQFGSLYNKIITTNERVVTVTAEVPRLEASADVSKALKTMMAGDSASAGQVSRQISFSNQLSGKRGIVRWIVMSKRVQFASRGVITPSRRFLKFGEAGIPSMIGCAMIRERVHPGNIDKLNEMMNEGSLKFVTDGTQLRQVSPHNPRCKLKLGDIVHRDLSDGDYHIFSRHPTLHCLSMMAIKVVRTTEASTIEIHSSVTTPHGADFDGDEGTANAPQSIMTRAEMMCVMNVNRNIMSPHRSNPAMGIVYNGLLSSHILSHQGTILPRVWENCVNTLQDHSRLSTLDQRLKKHRGGVIRDGKALFSVLLPSNLTFRNKNISIKEGIVIEGEITGDEIGPKSRSIIHMMHKHFGAPTTARFISECQTLADCFSESIAFSISLSDIRPANHLTIADSVKKSQEAVQREIWALGENVSDDIERTICRQVGNLTTLGSSIIDEHISKSGAIYRMVKSGSKGNAADVAQMMGHVGQVFISNERIRPEIFGRITPSFSPNSERMEARGFVANSFVRGLNASEFFIVSMAARSGLVNTSIGTSKTGYMSRQAATSFEDVKVFSDGTIRSSNGSILSLCSGWGMCPREILETSTPEIDYDFVASCL